MARRGTGAKERGLSDYRQREKYAEQFLSKCSKSVKMIEKLIDDYDSLKINWLKSNRKEG